ncbi:MAG: hypothetical protein F6K10_33135 [Moorea sp. SIO2B7]|nr:hypothetical protein [Moorena sp. SIO2B7]
MSWQNFLEAICINEEYSLTRSQIEVLMCLKENKEQTKKELLETYHQRYSYLGEEAFTQRLKKIYEKFPLEGKESKKLPLLHKFLAKKYIEYKNKDVFFHEIGLTDIYASFPNNVFEEKINKIINSENKKEKTLDILQTFAPNLDNYYEHLVQGIENGVNIRILLAWPYSEAAKLRENVLRKYTDSTLPNDINIQDCVIENLETLERVIKKTGETDLINIRLYDTLPSLAMYRAGNYMLVGLFLHGNLAVNTFQLELNLNSANQLIADTLKKDFELIWKTSRSFCPSPDRHWRNDLKILFMEDKL